MRLDRFGLTATLVILALGLWAGVLLARGDGISGRCAASNGCSCHDSSPDANGAVTVQITGPQTVNVGTTNSYTVSVSGGPSGSAGGFDLCVSDGTLTPGFGCQMDQGELTHTDNSNRFWSFQWTAPATPTSVDFNAVGQATDGSRTSGDSWNWYGGSAGSPFTVTVDATVPVLPTSWGRLKERYR